MDVTGDRVNVAGIDSEWMVREVPAALLPHDAGSPAGIRRESDLAVGMLGRALASMSLPVPA